MALEFEKEYLETQLSENSPFTSLNENAGEKIEKSMEKDFEDENKEILVAEENKNIIGCVEISKSKLDGIYDVKEVGKMNFLYVKKEFRDIGVASKLYNEAVRLLKQKGVRYISVMTSPRNKRAYSFYKKIGFEEYEIEFIKKI